MKIIIGLGNPGKQYKKNRHNVGFILLDYLAKSVKVKSKKNSLKLKSEITKVEFNNQNIILVKPQTFMNQSGIAVQKVLQYLKGDIKDLIIIHDDLDIRFGEYKIQIGKGPKLHNGLASIENQLSTKNFLRLRIGVDNREEENRISGEAYVLQDFNEQEFKRLQKIANNLKLF